MKNGFTLIEILVVVTIMGVLAAVGVASYNKLGDRAKIEQDAQLLATKLRSWQKDVDSGVGNGECSSGQSYQGILIKYFSSTQIQSQSICSGTYKTAKTYSLLNNTSTMTSFTDFAFRSLGAGVSAPPAGGIIIKNADDSIEYTITLTSSGGLNVAKTK